MARARSIKPGFFANEELIELPFEYRLLFAGLWTIADRDGRMEDRPKRIKLQIFPGDNVDVDAGLNALAEKDFIRRYEVNGIRYLLVTNWAKHQSPHIKETASTIPAPCEHSADTSAAALTPSSLTPDSPFPISHSSSLRSHTSTASTESLESVSTHEVFDHWKQEHGHPKAQLDTKRRRRIGEALKKFSVEDLRKCITGYSYSPHHMGTDPKGNGVRYDDIELFLRDSKHIEAGLQFYAHPPRPPPEKKFLSAGEMVEQAYREKNGNGRVVSEQFGSSGEDLEESFRGLRPALPS